MTESIESAARLNNGVLIPYLGLGTWESGKGEETQNAVRWALEAGYRHIDTAAFYGNERDVGVAVNNNGVPREEVFVTTKVWNSDQGYDKTIRALEDSLTRLGFDYVDLYLVHWPVEKLRSETWRALEKLYEEGKCKAIGVSNYTIRHLKELLEENEVVPAVNQVEFSPFLYQGKLLRFCRSHGIQLEAYSPLARAKKLDNKMLASVAEKHERTPAQVMLRWALQHNVVVIPKSVHRERIIENASVFDFEISGEDMKLLNSLNEDYRTCWDPNEIP